MFDKKYSILLLGGTGFVGKILCARFAQENHAVTVLSRRPEEHRDLEVLPNVSVKKADIFDEQSLLYYCNGVDVVINLVGILNARDIRGKEFQRVHVELVRKIINACQIQRVKQFIHFSSLNADAKSGASRYLRSKGEAEVLIRQAQQAGLETTIFRPSIIIGPGANFLKQFVKLLKYAPGVFFLPCAKSISSPVSVYDVVAAVSQSVMNYPCYNKTFDLCGPITYSLKELVRIMAQSMNKRCWIIGLNFFFSMALAQIFQFFPGKPLTPDNVRSARVPSTSPDSFPSVLGILPSGIEGLMKRVIHEQESSLTFFDRARKMS